MKKTKQVGEYYIGADIGTDSLGWAVTDSDYKLKKYRGNAMWGIRLLDESKTAEERRAFRTAARRTKRKRDRIEWLQMLFDEEISKVDTSFFQRLKESSLYPEDKSTGIPYTVFSDEEFTDKDYHRLYPTVFHLRKELIEDASAHDVRLVYLALHHLIKHRGHFLFESLSTDEIASFEKVFEDCADYLSEDLDVELACEDQNELAEILKSKSMTKTAKKTAALSVCGINKKENPQAAAALNLLCGNKEKLSVLFNDESLDEEETAKIELGGNFEEKSAEYQLVLGERYTVIEKLKAVYDWTILADILNGERYISVAKVKGFEKHANDLRLLKRYVKTHCPQKYSEIFRVSRSGLNNYTAYSGKIKTKGATGVLNQKCNQQEFCDYLKKALKGQPQDGFEQMFVDIEAGVFMPKHRIKENGVIPMQVNRAELIKILDNAKVYLPFLSQVDEMGKTISDKIIAIFSFRIPYYVGPLNRYSDKAWLERKDGKIYPWNFAEIVNIDRSAENFIKNLTSKCTYLPTKDVLPKNSVLYSRFSVLNELNNLWINGERISVDLKQAIFSDLFLSKKKVTQKALKNYLISNGYRDVEITGIDGDFKSNMKSYLDLAQFNLTEDQMERIITSVTIFGDDRALLKKRISNEFGVKISDQAIDRISRLSYSGWGRLSREFLTEITSPNPETGEVMNFITALWETNDNLMILLGSKYTFAASLHNALTDNHELTMREMVESLYVSPKIKRPIYQTLRVIDEIIDIEKKAPKKIFIEVARYQGEKHKRTVSRKNRLLDLYKACQKETGELFESLNVTDAERLRADKLYLYYTQMGKCMYTGEQIDLNQLITGNDYDIDHIYPQSKVKDDSLDNRVLVKKNMNAEKGNNYPLSEQIRKAMHLFWKLILDKGLISKEKLFRLTRAYPLSDDELSDFIARQIVETGQATKAVAQILRQLYPETSVVYVKAALASEFRSKKDMLKCREVNDLHHAKDAYLNIVVGNVFDERCTRNKANFIKGLQRGVVSINGMFDYDTPGAWTANNNETLSLVKQTMRKSNVLFTRYAFCQSGSLFKLNPLKKGSGQVSLKKNGALSDIEKYGGYDKPISTYFSLVKHIDKKGKEVKTLIPIDLYLKNEYEKDPVGFMKNAIGLTDPEILIPCVKYNTCLSFDGFRMHISSKSDGGKAIVYKPAMQLVLGYSQELYIRNITKYLDKYGYREPNASDELSADENLALYYEFLHKMIDTVFKVKFASMGEKITSKTERFIELPVKDQCFVLREILRMLHANVLKADLSLIGLASKAGTVKSNAELSAVKEAKTIQIINQSVTGLYENTYTII